MKKIYSENIFILIGDKGRHGDNDKHKVGEDARVREKMFPFLFVNKVSAYFCQKISTMNWQRIRMRGDSADCTLDGPPPPTSVSLVEIYYCSRDKSMSALSHKSKVRCKQIHEEERRGGLMAK